MVRLSLDHGTSRKRTKAPPDYLSRRVQRRMLGLLASFIVVLILMSEARKPKNWQWMWHLSRSAPPAADTELDAPPMPDNGAADVIQIERGDEDPTTEFADSADSDPDWTETTRRDGWRRVLDQLSVDQDGLLRTCLRRIRHNEPLPPDDRHQLPPLVETLDGLWNRYHSDALIAVGQQGSRLSNSAEQVQHWLAILEASRHRWTQTHQALTALGSDDAISPEVRDELHRLQDMLDQLALAQVEDNTVFRADERLAWFRLWEELLMLNEVQLQQRSLGQTSFLQLFNQPDVYRGKVVHVRGTAKLAYRVPAPANDVGVEAYYLIWIRPDDNSDSPIVVYCLELPEGFPEVVDRNQGDDETTLNERMEFTGFFFKRWAYPAQVHLNVAPLVMARRGSWFPGVAAVDGASKAIPWPVVGFCAVLAAVAAGLVTWRITRTSRDDETDREAVLRRYRRPEDQQR